LFTNPFLLLIFSKVKNTFYLKGVVQYIPFEMAYEAWLGIVFWRGSSIMKNA
jgi:hypothetical protein